MVVITDQFKKYINVNIYTALFKMQWTYNSIFINEHYCIYLMQPDI